MNSRRIRIALVIAAVLALSACRKTTPEAAAAATETETLTGAAELLVGTLALESTEHEIDAATAAKLVPLWKAYRALLTSDTAVPVEVEALEKQIRETMPAAQVQAIEAMRLTREEMAQVLQNQGGLSEGVRSGLDDEQRQAMRDAAGGRAGGFAAERGGLPGGMPAGGEGLAMRGGAGGPGMIPGGMDPSAMATMLADGGALYVVGAQGDAMLAPLVQVVIAVLEGKTQ